MQETAQRIRDLEMALRESMNTSAHREALWAQEEATRVQAQREVQKDVTHLLTNKHTYTHTHTGCHELRGFPVDFNPYPNDNQLPTGATTKDFIKKYLHKFLGVLG